MRGSGVLPAEIGLSSIFHAPQGCSFGVLPRALILTRKVAYAPFRSCLRGAVFAYANDERPDVNLSRSLVASRGMRRGERLWSGGFGADRHEGFANIARPPQLVLQFLERLRY